MALAKAGIDIEAASKSKALELLAAHHVDFDANSEEAKRVLQKIDMRIMPMVLGIYLLQLMVAFSRTVHRPLPRGTNVRFTIGQEQSVFCCNHGHQDRCEPHREPVLLAGLYCVVSFQVWAI